MRAKRQNPKAAAAVSAVQFGAPVIEVAEPDPAKPVVGVVAAWVYKCTRQVPLSSPECSADIEIFGLFLFMPIDVVEAG